jgi:hypothetical protein
MNPSAGSYTLGACYGGRLGLGGLTEQRSCLAAGQDHEHTLALNHRSALDGRDFLELLGHLLKQLTSKLRVSKLTTPEENGDFDLVTVIKKLDSPLRFGVEVMDADLRTEPDLLQLNRLLVLAGLSLLLGLLILKATVVEQTANRRLDVRSDLNQV